MRIDKELNRLRTHFLEHKEAEKPSFFKGSLRACNRFLPFLLGVNIGWVLSICIWKFCTKKANKSGLTVSEWIEEKLLFSFRSDKGAQAPSEAETSKPDSDKKTVEKKQAPKASKPLSGRAGAVKTEKHVPAITDKVKKVPSKKAKSGSKKTVSKTASAKAEEKKTLKKSAKAEKSVKKGAAASKAKKKTTNKSDDKGPS